MLDGGKMAAAEELYRQIVAEAPQSAAAWLGLSAVARDEAERSEAYARALELDPQFVAAEEQLKSGEDDEDQTAADPAKPAAAKSREPAPETAVTFSGMDVVTEPTSRAAKTPVRSGGYGCAVVLLPPPRPLDIPALL